MEDNPFVALGQNPSIGAHKPPDGPMRSIPNQGIEEMRHAIEIQRKIALAMPSVRSWREEATKSREMYDSHQWDDYDRMIMERQRRPALTYNEIKKVLRAICGIERLNRTEVRFRTRAMDSQYVEDLMGDLATEAVIAIDDLSDADKERSLVFLDVLIGGMGWMETYVSLEEDLDGQILKSRILPFEMIWDANARKSGISDSRWRGRVRRMPRDEFSRRWPGMLDFIDAAMEEPEIKSSDRYNLITPYYSLMNEQANPNVQNNSSENRDTVEVIQFQEKTEEPVYRMPDPDKQDSLVEFSQAEFDELKHEFLREGLPLPPVVRQVRTAHKQVYLSHGVLLEDPVDLPGNRFSLTCMTGEWDHKQNMWLGMVPEMIDPQKTKNKSISSALSFYLSNAKGGVMAETGAFVNEAQAKEQWSSPNPWIALKEGGLKKVDQRRPAEMPASLLTFFDIGTKSLTEIVGVNQELLGLAQMETGGPAQRSRVNAGLAILGWIFDEYDRFKKADAVTGLEFIRDFMSNGQLIQIGGDEYGQSIPLLKSNLPTKYRLQLDQSIRQNPNLKAQIWQDLMPIVPALMRFGAGRILLTLLKFSPLPAKVVSDIQKEVKRASEQEQEQGGGRGKQEPPELTEAKVLKTKAEAQRATAQATSYEKQAQAKVAELFLQGFRLTSDIANREADDEHRRGMDRADLQIEEEKVEMERKRLALELVELLQAMMSGGLNGRKEASDTGTSGNNGSASRSE